MSPIAAGIAGAVIGALADAGFVVARTRRDVHDAGEERHNVVH